MGHEAPGIDEIPHCVYCRQPILGRRHEAPALIDERDAPPHSQSTRARPRHFREGLFDIGGSLGLDELQLHPQRPPCRFRCLQQISLVVFAELPRLPEDSDPGESRDGLGEQLQTLADPIRGDAEDGQSGGIAARPGKLMTSPLPTGSATAVKTIGRVLVACLAARAPGVPALAKRTSTLRATRSAARAGNRSDSPRHLSVFDDDVATLDVAEVTEPLAEDSRKRGLAALKSIAR
jgi:hypothetical protein